MTIKHILFFDFESHYSKDYSLRSMSVPEYVLDDRFQVHLLAVYDPTWPAPRVLEAHEIEDFLKQYPANATMAIAHNMLFDGAILAWRYGWIPKRLQDTLGLVRSLRNFKRNSLGACAKELFGTDTKGDVLHKLKGLSVQGIKQAGLWPEYKTYAMQDVNLCSLIYFKLLPEFPVEERKVMDLVLRAALQPVLRADVNMLTVHLQELRQRKAMLLRECGFDRAALMSTALFQAALEDLGVDIERKISATGKQVPAFAKSDPFMAQLQEYDRSYDDDINFKVQTLATARLAHKSTIEETRVEKFIKIAGLQWMNGCKYPDCDGGPATGYCHENCKQHPALLPVALRFGGAHTHRLSGEWRLNMQNLPRDQSKSKLRTSLLAPPGHKLIAADLAQIECRITAQLCEQDNLLQQFCDGEDVYAWFASKIFDMPINKRQHPHQRFIGKTAVLGLGYGCGAVRFYNMVKVAARQYGIPLDDLFDSIKAHETVDLYRETFSKIAASWRMLDGKLQNYINCGNDNQFSSWGPVTFERGRIVLPNRMTLRYTFGDPSLYGAKLLENIVQALARIVIMQTAVRLNERYHLRFVLQSHDELVFAVPDSEVAWLKTVIMDEMVRVPDWLPGLPLAAEIGVGDNYGRCK